MEVDLKTDVFTSKLPYATPTYLTTPKTKSPTNQGNQQDPIAVEDPRATNKTGINNPAVIKNDVPSHKDQTKRPPPGLNHKFLLQSKSFQSGGQDSARPIYPNCPFSPYGSPNGSPRCSRKRGPLKESRRVSIEKAGTYLQLNQYKLLDAIGQVGCLDIFHPTIKTFGHF